MKAERQGAMAEPCLVLTLQGLQRDEVTLLKLDGQELQVRIHTHGLNGRSFTISEYQPLSTLDDVNKSGADWITCVFCWEDLPCHSQRDRGPAPFCGYCGDAPSWHCGLCCPYNDNGRNPIRMEASVD